MKKTRFMAAALILAALVSAAACGGGGTSSVPSEEAAIKAYQAAASAYEYAQIMPLPVDASSAPVVVNGADYYKVTDPAFKTLEDFEKLLEASFSDQIIADLLEGDVRVYIDNEGELYALNGGRGTDPSIGKETYTYEKISDTKIILKVSAENLAEDLVTVTDSTVYEFSYELQDGKWVFTTFPYFR